MCKGMCTGIGMGECTGMGKGKSKGMGKGRRKGKGMARVTLGVGGSRDTVGVCLGARLGRDEG